jgi:hypothetical protein
MPTRSATLAVVTPPANTLTTLLTVPAGMTYIVKSAHLYSTGGAADTVYLFAQRPGPLFGMMLDGAVVAAGGTLEWSGWLVLAPADTLVAQSVQGGTHFWVSGTKLTGVA